MYKIIKTIVNFKNLCKRKLARSKTAVYTNIISDMSMSKSFAKKRKEMLIDQKAKLHDRLYDYADKIIKEYDPCKIKDGKCVKISPCCGGCKYLTTNGCSIKCLWCKLWLCDYLLKNPEYHLLVSRLRKIEKVASRKRILIARGSKEDLIRHLKNSCITRRYFRKMENL